VERDLSSGATARHPATVDGVMGDDGIIAAFHIKAILSIIIKDVSTDVDATRGIDRVLVHRVASNATTISTRMEDRVIHDPNIAGIKSMDHNATGVVFNV
jgi:hypothetical protein